MKNFIKKFFSIGIVLLFIISIFTLCKQNSVLSFANLRPTKNTQTSESIKNPKLNSEKSKTIIPIAMATDNNYTDVTLVSIISALDNADKDTQLKFYIMVTDDFSESNKQKIQKVIDMFKNCNIELINMGNSFKEFYLGHWGPAMYYRLKLSSLLKHENKCIYLDGDTLVLKDLKDMYNLDISEYYVAGVADYYRNYDEYGKNLEITDMKHYICSGVLLWNLDKIREDNIEDKFLGFLKDTSENGKKLLCPDQDIINLVCYDKILDLPFKYGALSGVIGCKRYAGNLIRILPEKEWLEAKDNPVIVHFAAWKKPWKRKVIFGDIWLKYRDEINNILNNKNTTLIK